MKETPKIELRVPKQELTKLSIDISTPGEMAGWLEALPKVNVWESARQLYGAIKELNRLQADPQTRFQILEEMRPSIHYICRSLGRYFLNQSIKLDEEESQVAKLCQALQNHLATGYGISLIETLKLKGNKAAELRAVVTQRALAELSAMLFRSFQLYLPPRKGLWKEIHQLYLLAEHYDFLDKVIDDPSNKTQISIRDQYCKTLLLSAASPNQLRQQEIAQLSKAFNVWAQHCKIYSSAETGKSMPFVINLHDDRGVIYAKWDTKLMQSKHLNIRYIDMSGLADTVKHRLATINDKEKIDIRVKVLSQHVLRHLQQTWSASVNRRFARVPCEGKLSVVIGLTDSHHLIADSMNEGKDKKADQELVDSEVETSGNPFLKQKGNRNYSIEDEIRSRGDIWSLRATENSSHKVLSKESVGQEGVLAKLKKPKAKEVRIFDNEMIDTSPDGYRLKWQGDIPAELKTGGLVCLKESKQNHWSIGSVRWLQKVSKEVTEIGLELLAPHAEAISAKVFLEDGTSSRRMRVIRLPELKTINKASTLITAALAFRTGDRVVLKANGKELRAILQEETYSTASFSQFAYKVLGETKTPGTRSYRIDELMDDEDLNSL